MRPDPPEETRPTHLAPSRTVPMRRLTLVLTILFGVVGTIAILQYPDVPVWLMAATLIYVLYYLGVSLFSSKKMEQRSAE